jgi:DNA (cytosine-5)-methyltransferase 1
MTHGSLFSGIGGFDLAAEWIGWENKFHCEWNPFGQKVLKHYWPEAESFTDITKSNFEKYAGTIDVISGGFPCQPYSSAGKRLGKDDPRHLWPEMLRVISEVRPRWVVGENVRGLTNWNGGMVFDEVQSDLETIGFEVIPFLLPAAAVNAPHRRDRIWFIAHAIGDGYGTNEHGSLRQTNGTNKGKGTQTFYNAIGSNGNQGTSSNTDSDGLHECDRINEINASEGRFNAQCNIEQSIGDGYVKNSNSIGQERGMYAEQSENAVRQQFSKSNAWINERQSWDNFPTQSPICNGDDGISERLDGITFSKWRKESIKGGGNAIVPQVAYQIFKTIQTQNHDLYSMQAHNASTTKRTHLSRCPADNREGL